MTGHKGSTSKRPARAGAAGVLVLAAIWICLSPVPLLAAAGWSDLRTGTLDPRDVLELELAGLTALPLRQQEFGQPQDEFGGAAPLAEEEQANGPSNLGDKIKAGALSAILPGAGQYYNGHHRKAYIFAGAEVAVWTAYFVFDTQGDNRLETSREYALIYAGVSGEHNDDYWQAVGRYLDSDLYWDALAREARALGEELPPQLTGDDAWIWVNDDRRKEYLMVRADANRAYDRRDFTILFAVVNRAISVVDAVLGAGGDDQPGVDTGVMGLRLNVDVNPAWSDPGGRCLLTGSF